MLSRSDDILARCESDICRILKIAGTNQCTIHLEVIPRDPQRKTYLAGKPQDGLEDTVFPWGSLTKIVVAAALSIIIDEYAESDRPEYERYRPLRDAWKKPFIECLNKASRVKMLDLPDDAKVEQLVCHFAGIPQLNHIILAPDGTPLMSSDAFPAVACQLTTDAYGESKSYRSRWEYSNGNTILIGILIEAISGKSLPEAVDEIVFKRFGMYSAYMGARPDDPNAAIPHEASAEGTIPISFPETLSDPLCIAAMGVFSNVHDIATFFRSIVDALPKEGKDRQPTAITRLLEPYANTGLEEGCRYSPLGIFTSLDKSVPGCQSLNRTVSPESRPSTYTLGLEQPGNKPVDVYYHAGVINGFECCSYIISKFRAFLVVLSDTTGRVDPTDHISRLILQTFFELEPRNSRRADIPAMAQQGMEERAALLADLAASQSVPDKPTMPRAALVGTYTHAKYRQSFLVTENDGGLWVRWQGSRLVDGHPAQSREMRLLRISPRLVRMVAPNTVDRFGAWRDRDFIIKYDSFSGEVVSLSRRDPNDAHNFLTYVRTPLV